MVLNETVNVYMNDEVYRIKIMRYSQGPIRINVPKTCEKNEQNSESKNNASEYSKDDESSDEDGWGKLGGTYINDNDYNMVKD